MLMFVNKIGSRMKKIILVFLIAAPFISFAQTTMTPELLWQMGRVSAIGISKDKQYVIYSVLIPDVAQNKSDIKTYRILVDGGTAEQISSADTLVYNNHISP